MVCGTVWLYSCAVRIIKRRTLLDYAAPASAAISLWLDKASVARWGKPERVLADFPSAKVLDGERIRFEIGQNYRLIAVFFWQAETAYIKFIGTHAEYDRVDARTVDLF